MTESTLNKHLCFNLYNLQRQISRLYNNHILSDLNLTYPQLLVMSLLLNHKRLNLKSIANMLYLDNATVSSLIKRMEKTGYIARRRDAYDQRHVYIEATEKGRQLAPRIHEAFAQFNDILNFGDKETEDLLLKINEVNRILERENTPRL